MRRDDGEEDAPGFWISSCFFSYYFTNERRRWRAQIHVLLFYIFPFSACRFYSRHQDWLLIVASYSLSLTGWLGGRRRASANASISLLVDHRTVDRTCGSVANSETGDFARMFLCICRWRRRRTSPNSLVGCRFRSQFREREWDEDVHSLSEEFIETGSSIYFPFLVFSWRWS